MKAIALILVLLFASPGLFARPTARHRTRHGLSAKVHKGKKGRRHQARHRAKRRPAATAAAPVNQAPPAPPADSAPVA